MQWFPILGPLILIVLLEPHSTIAATCTISSYNEDDITNATKECSDITLNSISIPAGVTLKLNLKQGAKLTFQGTLTWGYQEWDGPLLNITGTDVEITGMPDHVLDPKGGLWWDGKAEVGGKTKPVSFVFNKLRNAVIHSVTIKNTPFHAIWIEDSDGVVVQDVLVNNTEGRTLGKGTDGINVWRSNNVTIQRFTVYNQDDCVAIKSGTNILIEDSYCSGGHGLSIGSVGGRDYNIVENVTVSNSQILNSANGVRIKTVYNATGAVTNVTYKDIVLTDINSYGIIAHGNYNGPSGSSPTGGVSITHFVLQNVTGTVKDTGTNIFIQVNNASDWLWTGVNVTGGGRIRQCEGIPDDSGISCN
ncbi:hypothetical protein NQ315_014131 [Exocentrus adspersus]|uniref:endo-polygalacturonase n=1 Tax=Exocentrus adspersus TaxID=1586481 RepID=A0AAV8VWI9_9CUCU|nr:hypothetical protein NQ315_014131 [Exocentrus adspersus]